MLASTLSRMDWKATDHGKPGGIREILKRRVVISRPTFGRWLVTIKPGRGGPHQVRHDDAPGEDRSDERVEVDWRYAPRLLLIAGLLASLSLSAFLGTACIGLVVDRFRLVEAAQKDPLWDLVGRMSTVQAEQGATLKQHEAALRDMAMLSARMADMQAELRVLNERLRRKGL